MKKIFAVVGAMLLVSGCGTLDQAPAPQPVTMTRSVVIIMHQGAQLEVGNIEPLIEKVTNGGITEEASADAEANTEGAAEPSTTNTTDASIPISGLPGK